MEKAELDSLNIRELAVDEQDQVAGGSLAPAPLPDRFALNYFWLLGVAPYL